MKTLITIVASVLLLGCASETESVTGTTTEGALLAKGGTGTVLFGDEISPQERASLLWMREEEKLARDIYFRMNERWHYRVFANIQQSEEQHMRAMLMLLNRYTIPDPVGENGVGVFTDPQLQALYNQLLARGMQSLNEAIAVGIVIEQTDIADLQQGIRITDNRDIKQVYQNLLQASRNHLRAFSRHVANAVE